MHSPPRQHHRPVDALIRQLEVQLAVLIVFPTEVERLGDRAPLEHPRLGGTPQKVGDVLLGNELHQTPRGLVVIAPVYQELGARVFVDEGRHQTPQHRKDARRPG